MPFRPERLKEAREKKRLSQRDLCELSGMSEPQLSRYENGKAEPSLRYLEVLAKYLEVTSDFLLGLSDDPHKRYGDRELTDDEREMLDTFHLEGWRGVIRLG